MRPVDEAILAFWENIIRGVESAMFCDGLFDVINAVTWFRVISRRS